MAEMKARITLDSSGYKSGAFSVIEDTENMINATKKARESIEQLSNMKAQTKISADISEAEKNVSKMRESINNLKKNVSFMVQARDEASASISKIKTNVTELIKTNYKLEISAVDKTKSIISGIRDSIFNLKTLAAGIVLGGAGKAAYDWTIGNGISNENYLATLQTVMHDKAKGSEALKWSYNTAQTTPFNAEQVVAGTTQLATSGLDYKKYLTPLGDAAAAFNRPIEQAIFAMGKLKSGQYGMAVDMFRDFGISNTDWTKAGATFSKNGEMQMSDPQKAVDMVTKIINQKYGGLMEKKSNTAGGMMSNIGDSISGMGRSLAGIDSEGQIMKGGLFDNFKQQLQVIMPLLDRVQKTQAFKDLQKDISNLATAGGQKLTAFLKGFDNPKTIKEYEANFKRFIDDVKAGITIAKEFGSALLAVGKVLEPLIKLVAAHPKIFVGLFAGYEGIKGVSTALGVLKNLGSVLKYLPTAVGVFGLNVAGVFKSVLGVIKAFPGSAITALKPFFAFIVGNPVVLAIAGISLAVIGLHEAWINNWGDIQGKTHAVIKAIEDDWEAWKKEWTKLKEFFKDPITATIKSVNEGTTVNTKRVAGAGPQGLAVDAGHNALGTSYWKGGPTWINEVGAELVELPGGTKIHSNRETENMMNSKNNQLPNMTFSSTIANQSKSMVPQADKWGQDIPNNLAKGIKSNTKSVTDAVTFMATKIRELIHFSVPDKGPLSDFDTYSVDMLKNFGTGIKNNTKLVTDPTTNMSTDVKNVYSQLSTASNSYGQQAIQEFGNGVQNMTNNLTDIVKTLTDKVIQQFKTGFGIHSPSKVMFEMGGHLMQGLINGMSNKDVEGFITNWIGSITSSAGGAISGNLQMWIATAMALTGVSSDWFGPLATLIQHESGGDPNSINLWDSNAAAGHPSKGLMQLIDENMSENHLPGMDDIWNPIDNIAAGIRLIQHDYGSIYNVPGIKALASGGSYVGYANGGITNQPSIFGEAGPEAAIPLKKNNSRSQQLLDIADNYINGDKNSSKGDKDVKVYVKILGNVIGNEEFADEVGEHITKKVRLAIQNM